MRQYAPFMITIVFFILLLTGGCRRNRIPISTEIPDSANRLEALALANDSMLEAIIFATEYIETHPFNNSEQARVEGYRYVGAVIRAGIDAKLLADPDFPVFRNIPDETTRIGLDNPDNLYLITDIRPGNTYRIWGNKGTSRDFVFQQYDADNARGGWAINLDSMEFSDEGDFVLWLGPEAAENRQGSSWETNEMLLMEEANVLLVRFTHSDWETEEPGVVHIERIGSTGAMESVPDAVEMRRSLSNLAEYIIFHTTYWVDWLGDISRILPANTVRTPRKTSVEGLPTQYSAFVHYAIADNEALIITTRPTAARYQAFSWLICGTSLWNTAIGKPASPATRHGYLQMVHTISS